MLRKVDSRTMGKADHGWLKSLFHFSFADYYRPDNIQFGVLRVLNDDIIEAGTGFELHPHRDMEIISYVIDGSLTHGDSMGNQSTLSAGDFQYMSAGTGVMHSEHNRGLGPGRFLQIWILPDQRGHVPQYGDLKNVSALAEQKWHHAVSSFEGDGDIKIHQDVNILVGRFKGTQKLRIEVKQGRQAYLVQIKGSSSIDDIQLMARDALEISNETLDLSLISDSHFMLIEMKKAQ